MCIRDSTNVGQNAAPGRILASIVDLHDLFVRVYVPETRIGTVSVGQAVSVSSDSGGAAIAGTVSFVSAQAEFTPNTVQTAEQRAKLCLLYTSHAGHRHAHRRP